MSTYPASTVRVVSIEPCGDVKVRIMVEMIVDVHRLSEVGSELLHQAITQVKAQQKTAKKK